MAASLGTTYWSAQSFEFLLIRSTMSWVMLVLTASILSSVRANSIFSTFSLRKEGWVMKFLKIYMIWHLMRQFSPPSCWSSGFTIFYSKASFPILAER